MNARQKENQDLLYLGIQTKMAALEAEREHLALMLKAGVGVRPTTGRKRVTGSTLTTKKVHWTQRPENRAKVAKNVAKAIAAKTTTKRGR